MYNDRIRQPHQAPSVLVVVDCEMLCKKAHSRYESHIAFIFQGLQKAWKVVPYLHKRGSRLLVKLEESHAVLVQFSSTIQVHTHL